MALPVSEHLKQGGQVGLHLGLREVGLDYLKVLNLTLLLKIFEKIFFKYV